MNNIQIAGNIIPVVNVDSMPTYQSNVICNKKYVPQIVFNDGYWVSIQDLISAVADEKEIQILTNSIRCEYTQHPEVLKLFLKGCWTLAQLECINEAITFIPHNESKDVSFDSLEGNIVVIVRFD